MTPPLPRLLPDGGTVLILGAGPSLTQADVTLARQHVALTIAVNNSYLFAPDADILYACDGRWWSWHQECRSAHLYQGKKYPAFSGRYKVSMTSLGHVRAADILLYRQGSQMGLSTDPTKLATGKNGVYQALNLAVHLGATGAILLGVDMQAGKVHRDGVWRPSDHFHGRHVDNSKPPYELCRQRFATLVDPLAAIGFTVTNCTPGSALRCFPQRDLRDVCAPLEATG